MDAWAQLISGSTIPSGDAWEHLLAQGGTGGGTTEYVYLSGFDAQVSPARIEAEVNRMEIDAQTDAANVTVELSTVAIDAELASGPTT